MASHGIGAIDLVVVNLYPFAQTVTRGAARDEVIENIDIGGPAMVRSAAKNHAFVAIVTDPADESAEMGPLISAGQRESVQGFLDEVDIAFAGDAPSGPGFWLPPSVVVAASPEQRIWREEIFGPVVTAYVYDDDRWSETLDLVDRTSPYALTGAVFAGDRRAIVEAASALRYAAGNFYINDKPTGAVVGQQPFGGARASGTNDKAGSALNLLRWTSARSIKETFVPPTQHRYAHQDPDPESNR